MNTIIFIVLSVLITFNDDGLATIYRDNFKSGPGDECGTWVSMNTLYLPFVSMGGASLPISNVSISGVSLPVTCGSAIFNAGQAGTIIYPMLIDLRYGGAIIFNLEFYGIAEDEFYVGVFDGTTWHESSADNITRFGGFYIDAGTYSAIRISIGPNHESLALYELELIFSKLW